TNLLSEQEKNSVTGFAKTIAAYQFMIPANWLYQNGIRIDVKDEMNPGPFVSYEEALNHIQNLIDEGYNELNNAASTTYYKLSVGFNGFNTIDGLKEVNRAIAARIAIYRKDWPAAQTALNQFFMNLTGDLSVGPNHSYTGGTDANNPLFSAW